MGRLLVATANPGKLREFSEALAPAGFAVCGLDALSDRSEVAEAGETFEANARLKAEAYSLRTPLTVLADDSGIEVEALGGGPGVLSARYGGPDLDDCGRVELLLAELAVVPEPRRGVRFHCVLAVALRGRTLATFHGTVEGRVLLSPRQGGGFGYDPVFFHPPSGCAFSELSVAAKRAVSHRGEAIRGFLSALRTGDPRLAGVG